MAPIAISPPASPSLTSAQHSDSLARYKAYDHVHWYVGNAKQAASFYVSRMGFERIAYRGLETGSRIIASHVVRNGSVTFVLTSPLRALAQSSRYTAEEEAQLREIHAHLEQHGDAVKGCCLYHKRRLGDADILPDVAFEVDSVDAVYEMAVRNGAQVIASPRTSKDTHGCVRMATIKTYGDTTHTLVERKQYSGVFLPSYRSESGGKDPLSRFLPSVELEAIDHCVGNQDWDEMEDVCD